jgi:hypothetical protein
MKEIQISKYMHDRLRACEQHGDAVMMACIVAGIKGEIRFRQRLRQLIGSSDQWTAFFNVPVAYGDIDCVLLGPSGLYAFEVKAHWGLVVCDRGTWLHLKVGAGSQLYRGSLKNPSLQLLNGIKSLKERLANKGVRGVWVEAAVVFAHPAVKLVVQNTSDPLKIIRLDDLARVIVPSKSVSNRARIEEILTDRKVS